MTRKEQRDLTNDCFDGPARLKVTLPQFRELFCNHCRNPICGQAKWGQTPFDRRVQTWKERLYGNQRIISDLTLPSHLMINETDFPDIRKKLERLIVSAKRGDWEYLPEDDSSVVAAKSTTSAVDEAVRKLALMKDKKAPVLPPPESKEQEPELLPVEDVPVEEEQEPDTLQPQPPPTQPVPTASRMSLVNTPMPAGGFMLDGSRAPNVQQGVRSKPIVPTKDPWAPNKDVIVKPGSTVKLGKKSDG